MMERSPVHDVVSSGGSPLDEEVRTDMEGRMGQDFSDVRVHTGDAADTSARSVSAHAYTRSAPTSSSSAAPTTQDRRGAGPSSRTS